MIDLYTWTTPNCQKVNIAVTELGTACRLVPIDISQDQQFDPKFVKISPNNKVPAIVDHETGIAMMESGAILLYLAKKTGQLLPRDTKARWKAVEWLMWQMGGVGPALAQTIHFKSTDKAPCAEERFSKEACRLYGVLNNRLQGRDWIAEEYSMADIAVWPWISRFGRQGIELSDYPEVKRWYLEIAKRPAVQTGFDIPHRTTGIPLP